MEGWKGMAVAHAHLLDDVISLVSFGVDHDVMQ